MTGYETLNWATLNFIKKHLYRRLATPLNHALGRLAIARHVSDPTDARAQIVQVEHSLEIGLNLVKAWAVLIHVKSGGTIRQEQRRLIAPDALPTWLVEHLQELSAFHLEQTRPVFVQAETFYESLLLMSLVAAKVGTLKKLVMADTVDDAQFVSVRAIFEPPSTGPYASLGGLFKRIGGQSPAEQETGFQLQVLQELFHLNGAALRLQNNQRSGEQALMARLRATATVGRTDAFPELLASPARAGVSANDSQETLLANLLRAHNPGQNPAASPAASESGSNGGRHPAPADPDMENQSETLILPPPGFRESISALLGLPPRDSGVENQSKTPLPPSPDKNDELSEPASPAAELFSRPPEPGMIEQVEPENAADTLILPPPDYKRRLSRQPLSSRPEPRPAAESGDQDAVAPAD